MEYYFEGTLVSLEFVVNKITPIELSDKFFGLDKVIKEYENGIDIFYCKGKEIKMGISIYENRGIIFGKGLWIIPAYFKFRKAIQNYQ